MRQILADPNVLSNYGITEEVKFNVIEKANKVLLTPNPKPQTPNPIPQTPNPNPRPGAAQQGLQAAAHARQRAPSQVQRSPPPYLFQSAFKAVLIPLNRADFDELVTQARKQVEKGENVFRPVYVPSPLSAKRVVCIE